MELHERLRGIGATSTPGPSLGPAPVVAIVLCCWIASVTVLLPAVARGGTPERQRDVGDFALKEAGREEPGQRGRRGRRGQQQRQYSEEETKRLERQAFGDSRLIGALARFIPQVMRQNGTPGLNLALARRGEVIWEEGFGQASLETSAPMTPLTVTRAGSMSKPYVATAAMQLVERGVIDLDEPVNRYLTAFQVSNPLGDRQVTLRDLLTHRSGLSGNAAGSDFAPPVPLAQHLAEGYSREMFESFDGSVIERWSAKVGERYQYSNFGIATAGYLVEVINTERLSLSEYIQQKIIDPLGMTSTTLPPVQDAGHVRGDILASLSIGYSKFGPAHLPSPAVQIAEYPAANLLTIPGDHIRLLLAYLNGGTYNGYELLKPETVELMLTPVVSTGAGELGLVWHLIDRGQPSYNFGHAGAFMYGWANASRAYPEQHFAIVVSYNHWNMTDDGDRYREPELIAGFVSSWLTHEDANLVRGQPALSWAWKTSYVMGLIMVERLRGRLGIESPVTPEMVEAMVAGAQVRAEAENGEPIWDPGGFRAGVQDMSSVQMTPAAIEAFLKSENLRVLPEELDLLVRELGGEGLIFP